MEDNQITIQLEESYKIIRNSVLTVQSKSICSSKLSNGTSILENGKLEH